MNIEFIGVATFAIEWNPYKITSVANINYYSHKLQAFKDLLLTNYKFILSRWSIFLFIG